MTLTVEAALTLALQCAPSVDPSMIVGIGQRESGLDPLTMHDNSTGQIAHGAGVVAIALEHIAAGHSVDLGLMQINSRNLGLLGLTVADAFVPCISVKAAARLLALFSTYNTGSPSRGIQYATRIMTTIDEIKKGSEPGEGVTTSEVPAERQLCTARPEDVWERSECVTPGEGNPVR